MAKVAIIGATGNVGMFAAHAISEIPFVSDILLLGRPGREEVLDGISHDLLDSFAASGNDKRLSWTTEAEDLKGSDVIVCAAGVPRQPGQDRLDLAVKNARIVADISHEVADVAPETILLMVTNPVDVMTSVALTGSGLRPQQVFGLGTHLDSMRLKSLIASFFQVHVSEVHTRIIGEHGESMVPLWSATTIGGIQISNLPEFSRIPMREILDTVKDRGERIISKKGSTVYGPGEAIATLVRTVLGDENRILTVSAYVKSEVHDIGDVCISVPARINRCGVFPVTIKIDDDEVRSFQASVEKIRAVTGQILAKISSPED